MGKMFATCPYLLLLIAYVASANQLGDVIQTKTGLIQGKIQPSGLFGKYVQNFLNIPYAEAPVGELRFEKPRAKKPWNGTLKSTEHLIACIQPKLPGIIITEDCLILNVWTQFPRRKNASVMVWMHGGAFRNGFSGIYTGQNFVAVGDVILVTINYRLSALGFLTSGDGRIKGNFGLYDQRLAMAWVKDNIEYFGGNSNSITIFGESAGGGSVSAHTLSKGSWEYFDRAVLQSGSMLTPWAIMTDAQIKYGLQWYLKKINCKNDGNLVKCLRNASEDEWKEMSNSKGSETVWAGPVVDGEFISDLPKKIFERGDVKSHDIIIGTTKDEMFYQEQVLLRQSKKISDYLKKFEEKLKAHFKNSSEAVYKKARELYKPKCIPSYLEALKPIVAFESDIMFICASRNEAKLRSKLMNTTKVFVFQYSHAPLVPYIPDFYPYGSFGFSGHALDVVSVFGMPVNNTKFRPDDQTLSMRMILYWTNFAKTGDPNTGTIKLPIVVGDVDSLPTWPRYSNGKEEYLDMDSFSQMTVRTKLREMPCDFLADPEGFLRRQVTSGSTRYFLSAWVPVAVISAMFPWLAQ